MSREDVNSVAVPILRHRVIFHLGDEKAAGIAEAYKAYAAEK